MLSQGCSMAGDMYSNVAVGTQCSDRLCSCTRAGTSHGSSSIVVMIISHEQPAGSATVPEAEHSLMVVSVENLYRSVNPSVTIPHATCRHVIRLILFTAQKCKCLLCIESTQRGSGFVCPSINRQPTHPKVSQIFSDVWPHSMFQRLVQCTPAACYKRLQQHLNLVRSRLNIG